MALAAPPSAQPPLPDELLEEILLRLDAADDLARASASCSSFRRVVSVRGFLRRFRSLHPPPVLGFLSCSHSGTEFYRAQPPRKSAPAARSVAGAADFTFSFLPGPGPWRVRDARDGRVLLARTSASLLSFEDFVVCDPLHRRHVQIPHIHSDLTASAGHGGSICLYFDPFLAPAGKEGEESLRVICNVLSQTKMVAFVFSSVTGEWRAVASFSMGWTEYLLMQRHSAHSCFYWTACSGKAMLVLDALDMKFAVVDLPPQHDARQKAIVVTAEGRVGLLVLGGHVLNLFSKISPGNGFGADEWRHDKAIPLPRSPDCCWHICCSAMGCLLLQGTQEKFRSWNSATKAVHYFTLELKKLKFERLCVLKSEASPAYLYASFPLPWSLPSI